MIYIGIDPGEGGAIVSLEGDRIDGLCRLDQTEADISAWLDGLLSGWCAENCRAVIERVQPVPKIMRGVVASFKLGQNYGFLRGLLIANKIPFDEIRPQAWQKAMGCLTHGDKNISKAKAQQLFPGVRITHAIADALLLAEYCRRTRQAAEVRT